MSKVKIILDTRRKLEDGTYPIKFSIFISTDCRFFLSSGISVEEKEFYEGKIILNPRKDVFNNFLSNIYVKIHDYLLSLSLSGRLYNLKASQLKKELNLKIKNINIEEKDLTLIFYFNKFIAEKTKTKTIETYKYTLNKIFNYNDDTISLSDIDLKWLRNFEWQLKNEPLSINTISIIMRNLRAIFNYAIDEEAINHYPFRKFTIKNEETIKRSLTIEEIKLLKDYPCEPHLIVYRDLFMLMFYLIGINSIDLFNNKHSDNINKGRINYRRSKTGRLVSFFVIFLLLFLIFSFCPYICIVIGN